MDDDEDVEDHKDDGGDITNCEVMRMMMQMVRTMMIMINIEYDSEDTEGDGHMPHLLVPCRLLLRAAELLEAQNRQGRGDEGECAALGAVLPMLCCPCYCQHHHLHGHSIHHCPCHRHHCPDHPHGP